ncbi:MAG TPA: MauE/DoxX family redox-associated membrane protein [Aquihabitans sp.]|jgi:hypothetical protein|nr:MauE/DoxX family redox-associated membrane protein [Aquihabitans sp.]
MSPVAGPLFAAALLLALAGALKVSSPAPTRVALRSAGLPDSVLAARLIGAGEVAVAAYALLAGGRSAALVALAYVAFAAFSLRVIRATRGRASCGCFGASDAPLTTLHVGVDLAVAAVAGLAVLDPVPGIVDVAADTPLAGIPFLAFTVLLAWLVQVLLTALPQLQAAARPPRKVAR